jgi:hypothetical protein
LHRQLKLDGLSRSDAVQRVGIQECAAIGTGVILIDTRVFKHPNLKKPWFDYEWTDEFHHEKASTEDVYFTRNCSLLGMPVYCNWDAWSGHAKPIIVGRPLIPSCDDASKELIEAGKNGIHRNVALMEMNPGKDLGDILPQMRIGTRLVIDDREETQTRVESALLALKNGHRKTVKKKKHAAVR